MTCNYSCCTYTPESSEHVEEERQAVVTAVGLLPQVLRCAVWRGLLLIPLETASLLAPASQPSGIGIQEVCVQATWKFNRQRLSKVTTLYPLNTCTIYSCTLPHNHPVDLWITRPLIISCEWTKLTMKIWFSVPHSRWHYIALNIEDVCQSFTADRNKRGMLMLFNQYVVLVVLWKYTHWNILECAHRHAGDSKDILYVQWV